MKYINNLDSKFLLNFSKTFFKHYYNSDNIFIEKAGNSCIVKCWLNNKHTLVISLKDFEVICNDILCSQLAKMQWQKALAKHYGDNYLSDLKEFMFKHENKAHNKNLGRIDAQINRIREELSQ